MWPIWASKWWSMIIKARHFRRTEHYFLMRKLGDGQASRPAQDEADFRPFWAKLTEAETLLTYADEQETARHAIAVYQDVA